MPDTEQLVLVDLWSRVFARMSERDLLGEAVFEQLPPRSPLLGTADHVAKSTVAINDMSFENSMDYLASGDTPTVSS